MRLRAGLLTLCFGWAFAFYPNRESPDVGLSDLTDEDITTNAILRAVATFMEGNPLPGKPGFKPGELVGLDPLTPTSLFKAYFRADVSPNQFVQAIQNIVSGNNEVERLHAQESDYHFHCEQIATSITLFQQYRDGIFTQIKQSKDKMDLNAYEMARLETGTALHILQKFYSNTNWVEMGKRTPYRRLVKASDPVFPIASSATKTCKDCLPTESGSLKCSGNLLVDNLLTSGYKKSETCATKPKGKCGHGGKYDETRLQSPTGGINKETANPELSPHSNLHYKAAQLAEDATVEFFVGPGFGFLDSLGPSVFRKFFNLQGYSLTFVIDTTGSMSGEIELVKTTCINIIKKFVNSPDAPYNYVLVPFNDPSFGPAIVTHDVAYFQSQIGALTATGGDDCPEMSMNGLKLALANSEPRSNIFLFTDAGAKDVALLEEVMIQASSVQTQIYPMLTGYCSASGGGVEENEYEKLAKVTGQHYTLVQKGKLNSVLGITELALNSAPAVLVQVTERTKKLLFYVDETLQELSISVKKKNDVPFYFTLLTPGDSDKTWSRRKRAVTADTKVSSLVNTTNYQVIKVQVTQPGQWAVEMSSLDTYTFEIAGKSLLDFSYKIMEEKNGYVLPIQGRPEKGAEYILSVAVEGDSGKLTLTRVIIFDETGKINKAYDLNKSTDSRGELRVSVPVRFNLTSFMLGIGGKTENGSEFLRSKPHLIHTESISLKLSEGQKSTLTEGTSLNVLVIASNEGPDQTFTFNVKDELSLMRSFNPQSILIAQGQNVTLTATFEAPKPIRQQSSSLVTFTAKGGTSTNYLKSVITVVPEVKEIPDQDPPQYNITQLGDICKGKKKPVQVCKSHTWDLEFQAWDNRSAVSVELGLPAAEIPPVYSLNCSDTIISGVSWASCQYSSDCCYPHVSLILTDDTGNANLLDVDFRDSQKENGSSESRIQSSVVLAVSLLSAIFY
ncbi:von Willebrand factor A domain-containing protein 7-like isoform X1 [Polypterus senegalus]|uniref:von Willebrand factor A domain-containing protein 7-like isoform X1 n=1 Tax=Polypterus senegalus TaxID=55291 RepID=UPI001962D691|nr:von Willebrand factor A domain-containing protein 7-like isoform X1 [Polypterus senegalus]